MWRIWNRASGPSTMSEWGERARARPWYEPNNKGIDWLPLRCSSKGKPTNCLLVCICNRRADWRWMCVSVRARHNCFITMKYVRAVYIFEVLFCCCYYIQMSPFECVCVCVRWFVIFVGYVEYVCLATQTYEGAIKSNEPIMIVILWLTEYVFDMR